MFLVHPPLSPKNIYLSFSSAGSGLPPLGLCYLAANLQKHNIQVKILDCQAEKLDIPEAVRRIKSQIIDYKSQIIIGISSYSNFLSIISHFAREIKREIPNSLIIIGGGGITAQPKEVMQKYPEFDIGVIGEGEETIVELVKGIENGDWEKTRGIIYNNNGNIVQTEKRPFIENLDTLPFPAFDLLPDISKYYFPPLDSLNRLPATSLITSRGCPGKCIFCNKTLFGNIVRSHSADYIIEMIRKLRSDYKIKEIFFQDDTIFVHRNVLEELCEKLIKENSTSNFQITWCCYGRVDMVDRKILQLMKKAGCWQISYGIETASDKILNFLRKETNLEMIKEAVKITDSAGIRVKGLFMLGNFLETEETIQKTMRIIKELPLSDFHITYFTPYPGSISYNIAEKYGKFEKDVNKLNFFSPSFIPFGLTEEKLRYYYKKMYREFYFRPRIIFYYLKKIRSFKVFLRFIKTGFLFFLKKF
jgi:radical SAM superfamily enzyme YgiQ (UPF0313 family)